MNVGTALLSEDGIIDTLLSMASGSYSPGLLPPLDDASALRFGDVVLVVKVDGTSERHSRWPWMGLDDLAYRVLAAAATDVIAKGGLPKYVMVSLGIPPTYSLRDVRSIGRGISDFLRECGAFLLGGDTNASTKDLGVWIDAVVIGEARDVKPIVGASEGDVLCVTNCLGISALPALVHHAGLDYSVLKEDLKSILRRPKLPLGFLNMLNDVKASTDISDGLRSISRLLKLNGLSLELFEDLPICPEVREIMEEHGIGVEDVLAYLGEEFNIAYVPNEGIKPQYVLGRLVKGGVGVVTLGGRRVTGGWDDFREYIGRT